ncbi:MAG: GtrA family protein [bacterium]|nr:GtrA family protein [bacterium]
MIKLYYKYREAINYLFWGFASFLFNMGMFYLLNRVCGINALTANIAAWILCVIFVYITNRLFVFESKNEKILIEFLRFMSARVGTLLLEEFILFAGITVLRKDELIVKLTGQIFVIGSNYVLSKLWIFRKNH